MERGVDAAEKSRESGAARKRAGGMKKGKRRRETTGVFSERGKEAAPLRRRKETVPGMEFKRKIPGCMHPGTIIHW